MPYTLFNVSRVTHLMSIAPGIKCRKRNSPDKVKQNTSLPLTVAVRSFVIQWKGKGQAIYRFLIIVVWTAMIGDCLRWNYNSIVCLINAKYVKGFCNLKLGHACRVNDTFSFICNL